MTLLATGNWDSFFQERLRRVILAQEPGPRQRPSAALSQKVRQFYEQKCVISDGMPGPELHHVNEDRSDTLFANLVPIGGSFNQGIRLREFFDDLHPQHIRATARKAFEAGFCRRSYACNRVAAHIFWRHFDQWTKAAEALVFALAPLRPEGPPDLLLDTAANFTGLIKPHRREPQAYYWGAEFVSQLSLVMYDHADVRTTLDLADLALRLAKKGLISEHPEPLQERLWRMKKRFVLAHAPLVRSGREKSTANLISTIQEAESVARHDPQARLSAQFTEATLLRVLGKDRQSIDIANMALEDTRGADFWTVIGLNMELALSYTKRKEAGRARIHYGTAIDLATRHRMRFIPAAVVGDLQDPVELLETQLYSPQPCISRRGANPFSPRILSEIVAALPQA